MVLNDCANGIKMKILASLVYLIFTESLVNSKTILKVYKNTGDKVEQVRLKNLNLQLPNSGIYPYGKELDLDVDFRGPSQGELCTKDPQKRVNLTNKTLYFFEDLEPCQKPKEFHHSGQHRAVDNIERIDPADDEYAEKNELENMIYAIVKNEEGVVENEVKLYEKRIIEGEVFSVYYNVTFMILDANSYEVLRNEADLGKEIGSPIKASLDFRIVAL